MKSLEIIKNASMKAETSRGINITMMDEPVAQDYIVTINPGEDIIAAALSNTIKIVDAPRFSL